MAQAREALDGFDGDVMVLYGDTPFVSAGTLERMTAARATHDVVILGFEAADPARYGRLVVNGDKLERIVEYKDADPATRALTLCNSGVVCADAATLFSLIDAVGNDNASGEYYLTDIVEIAWKTGKTATAVSCDEAETLGINTRAELARAECLFQTAKRAEALENGVTLTAPETVFFSLDTYVGRDAIVEPNVVFGPNVTVESTARIRAFSHLEAVTSRWAPRSAPMPVCAPARSCPTTPMSAISSRSKTPASAKAPRSITSPILRCRDWRWHQHRCRHDHL